MRLISRIAPRRCGAVAVVCSAFLLCHLFVSTSASGVDADAIATAVRSTLDSISGGEALSPQSADIPSDSYISNDEGAKEQSAPGGLYAALGSALGGADAFSPSSVAPPVPSSEDDIAPSARFAEADLSPQAQRKQMRPVSSQSLADRVAASLSSAAALPPLDDESSALLNPLGSSFSSGLSRSVGMDSISRSMSRSKSGSKFGSRSGFSKKHRPSIDTSNGLPDDEVDVPATPLDIKPGAEKVTPLPKPQKSLPFPKFPPKPKKNQNQTDPFAPTPAHVGVEWSDPKQAKQVMHSFENQLNRMLEPIDQFLLKSGKRSRVLSDMDAAVAAVKPMVNEMRRNNRLYMWEVNNTAYNYMQKIHEHSAEAAYQVLKSMAGKEITQEESDVVVRKAVNAAIDAIRSDLEKLNQTLPSEVERMLKSAIDPDALHPKPILRDPFGIPIDQEAIQKEAGNFIEDALRKEREAQKEKEEREERYRDRDRNILKEIVESAAAYSNKVAKAYNKTKIEDRNPFEIPTDVLLKKIATRIDKATPKPKTSSSSSTSQNSTGSEDEEQLQTKVSSQIANLAKSLDSVGAKSDALDIHQLTAVLKDYVKENKALPTETSVKGIVKPVDAAIDNADSTDANAIVKAVKAALVSAHPTIVHQESQRIKQAEMESKLAEKKQQAIDKLTKRLAVQSSQLEALSKTVQEKMELSARKSQEAESEKKNGNSDEASSLKHEAEHAQSEALATRAKIVAKQKEMAHELTVIKQLKEEKQVYESESESLLRKLDVNKTSEPKEVFLDMKRILSKLERLDPHERAQIMGKLTSVMGKAKRVFQSSAADEDEKMHHLIESQKAELEKLNKKWEQSQAKRNGAGEHESSAKEGAKNPNETNEEKERLHKEASELEQKTSKVSDELKQLTDDLAKAQKEHGADDAQVKELTKLMQAKSAELKTLIEQVKTISNKLANLQGSSPSLLQVENKNVPTASHSDAVPVAALDQIASDAQALQSTADKKVTNGLASEAQDVVALTKELKLARELERESMSEHVGISAKELEANKAAARLPESEASKLPHSHTRFSARRLSRYAKPLDTDTLHGRPSLTEMLAHKPHFNVHPAQKAEAHPQLPEEIPEEMRDTDDLGSIDDPPTMLETHTHSRVRSRARSRARARHHVQHHSQHKARRGLPFLKQSTGSTMDRLNKMLAKYSEKPKQHFSHHLHNAAFIREKPNTRKMSVVDKLALLLASIKVPPSAKRRLPIMMQAIAGPLDRLKRDVDAHTPIEWWPERQKAIRIVNRWLKEGRTPSWSAQVERDIDLMNAELFHYQQNLFKGNEKLRWINKSASQDLADALGVKWNEMYDLDKEMSPAQLAAEREANIDAALSRVCFALRCTKKDKANIKASLKPKA